MKRLFLPLIGVLAVAALAFAPTALAGPHYNQGPTATVEGNSLVVTFKAVGLGNTVESADFNLSGDVTTEAQCFTKKGNPVNGVPKRDESTVNQSETFDVRNGSVTGRIEISPLSTLTCTGNQEVRILSATFDLTLTGDDLPPVHLEG